MNENVLVELILALPDKCLVQNDETLKYLKILGAKNIFKIGNLKFIENKEEFKDTRRFKKFEFSKQRKIWCASSTHEGEEQICMDVHKILKNKHKGLLTIIIPRHIERISNIIDIAKISGIDIDNIVPIYDMLKQKRLIV